MELYDATMGLAEHGGEVGYSDDLVQGPPLNLSGVGDHGVVLKRDDHLYLLTGRGDIQPGTVLTVSTNDLSTPMDSIRSNGSTIEGTIKYSNLLNHLS